MTLDAYRDASMLELFQMEAQAQTDVLTQGLLALERDPRAANHLEACMRAAHSLKGAARIVNLTPAVPVAHTMEDCLVMAQHGRLVLTPEHIDALLKGTDLLLRIARPPQPDGSHEVDESAITAYVASLQAMLDVAAPLPGGLNERSAATPSHNVSNATTGATATGMCTTPSASSPSHQEASGRERALRVTAKTLDRLLGLASEVTIESRWLSPFVKSLLNNKRQHDRTVSGLESLLASMRESNAGPTWIGQVEELIRQAGHTQQHLAERVNDIDRFDWRIGQLNQRIYDTAISCRMRPLSDGTSGLARMVRDLGRELGKIVRLDIVGDGTRVDRDVLEQLDAPLSHLLRNVVDHGIETPTERRAAGKPEEGVITLAARHSAGRLHIDIADDGKGVNLARLAGQVSARGFAPATTVSGMREEELLAFLFLPGFSTRGEVTDVSGRGVGLDAVQDAMRRLRGDVRMSQVTGVGTCFTLDLPLALSVVRALLVEVDGEPYAFPLGYVDHALTIRRDDIAQLEGHQHFAFEDRQIGLVSARQLLASRGDDAVARERLEVVLVSDEQQTYGVAVDRFLGERTLVLQPLDSRLGKIQDIKCGALMEDGSAVLVLDVGDLLRSIEKLNSAGRLTRIGSVQAEQAGQTKRILVVDDSLTVRELERKLLTKRGFDVSVAVDGMDGWNMVRAERFDLVISDVDMPRMDGIELVSLIKRDTRLGVMPVMIVSYKDRPEDRQRGLEAGADYYLAKSNFHDETLLSVVEDLIGAPSS